MDAMSLPLTLIIVGALSSISFQAQKMALLQSKQKPSSKVTALVDSGVNFGSFLMFLGLLLHIMDHYHKLSAQVVKYEKYVSVFIGIVLVLSGGSILSQPNVNGKVSSMQVVFLGIALIALSIKDIIE